MRQIVLNLVMNAAEAIGENEGQINITTGVTHKNGDFIKAAMNNDFSTDISDYIYIEIADNGCGMDAVTVKKIFDPFFSTKFTGRGLGLSAALGIIKSHQGAIDVESRPGEGSRFRVFLPIADTKHTDAENDDEEPAKIELSGKILLADDEETIRNITSMMLESLDVEVICAEDGLAAVEAFAQNREQIEVIILDVVMPKLNGEEACRKIREMDPQIPIIIASGYSFEETTARFKTTEFNGFLQKPFKLKELIEQINTAAQSRCAEAVTE